MNINGVKMQCQLNHKYKNLTMTFPKWQKEPDTIGKFGCKLTAFLNAYNLFNRGNDYKTINELNNEIRQKHGYKYLYCIKRYNNYEEAKKHCYGQESFLLDEVLFKILGIKAGVRNYKGFINIASKNDYYIIKTKYKNTGHFSLIINADFTYLDSATLKKVTPKKSDILEVRKITFEG